MTKYAKYEQLNHLDDFIAGKITYYVFLGYSPKIVEFDNSACECGHGCRDTKLLSLFGKSNGDLQWRLGKYSDGSGSFEEVFPCTSFEQAVSKLQEFITSMMDSGPSMSIVEAAEKYNLKIDAKYVMAAINKKLKAYYDEADSLKKRAVDIEEKARLLNIKNES